MEENKENQKKGRFIMNIVQFIIGGILLIFAFFYLETHPAEKTSMVSGIKIIYQKIEVFVKSFFNKDAKILDDKFSLIRTYKELISTFENGNCINLEELQYLKNKLIELEKIELENYINQRLDFYDTAKNYYDKINNQCKK